MPKKADGVCWEYMDTGRKLRLHAAELRTNNLLVCAYGHRSRKGAVAAAVREAKRLGMVVRRPFAGMPEKKGTHEAEIRALAKEVCGGG